MKKVLLLLAAVFLALGTAGGVYGAQETGLRQTIDSNLKGAMAYVMGQAPSPGIASVGGEWILIGASRSQQGLSQAYGQAYLKAARETMQRQEGVLSERKYTEYARAALGMMALSQDPENVGGYSLLEPLLDFDKTVYQGANGAAYALLALQKAEGEEYVRASERYVSYLLDAQLADGGFSLSQSEGDPDVTAMALQALALYKDRPEAKQGIERGLSFLSQAQNEGGGYTAWGDTGSSESVSQVIIALCQLGVDPADPRFVKEKGGLLENLLSYRTAEGGFRHLESQQTADLMASEQALCALTAYQRFLEGKSGLLDFSRDEGKEGPEKEEKAQQEEEKESQRGGALTEEGLKKAVLIAVSRGLFVALERI